MNDNLNSLQKIELDMLKIFQGICAKHNLKYYATGGTALGAVRHKGFIPWDDDIDVGMPRKDYERLKDIISKELPPEYYFLSPLEEYRKDYFTVEFCRICDKRYLLQLENQKESRPLHAWLDIFPIETIPSSKFFKLFWVYTFLFLRLLYVFSTFSKNADLNRPNRPWYEKLLIKFALLSKPERFLNAKICFKIADSFVSLFKCKNYSNYFIAWGAYKEKDVFPKQYFGGGTIYQFENITVILPSDADHYLKSIYGNYWELPPIEQRTRHKVKLVCIQNVDKR